MRTTHGRVFQRAAWVGTTALAAVLMLLAPTASSAQTTAARTGWGYGYNVQLQHYTKIARSNVIGDVTQAGFNWMTQQIDWQAVEVGPGDYDFTQLDNIVGDGNAAGLNIMLSFAYAPAFYRTPA